MFINFNHGPYNTTSADAVNKKRAYQVGIIDFVITTGFTMIKPILQRMAVFQARGFPFLQSQEFLAEEFGVSRKCINETFMILKAMGIITIKKRRFPRSRWLHNECFINPIMFTKYIVDSLYGTLDIFFFKKYFSLSRVTLIEQKSSRSKSFVTKSSQAEQERLQTVINASKWDQILGRPTVLHTSIVSI